MDTPSLSTRSSFSGSESHSRTCAYLQYSKNNESSNEGLAESRFINFPNTAIAKVESSEVDSEFMKSLQEIYALDSQCQCCQNLLKRYIQLVKTLDDLVKKESNTLEEEGYKPSQDNIILNEPWLESLEAKNPYSLATGIDNTLKTVDSKIATSTQGHVVGGFGSVLSYAGFAGELPVLLKKSLVYFRMYVALRRYTRGLKLPGCVRHFVYSKGDKGDLVYQKVIRNARKQAFNTKNELTKAYASCITRHLYWRASVLKLMGSTVAIAGLLLIFISYIVTYIDPSVQLAIYGYYLEAAAILFYFLMSMGISSHGKYIDIRANRGENAMQKALYEIERTSTDEHSIQLEPVRSSIDVQDPESDLNNPESDLQLEATTLKNAYEKAVLKRLRWDLNFSMGHLLANLLQEQKQSQLETVSTAVKSSPSIIKDPQGPVYNLLHGVLGLQDHSIANLMDVSKHNPIEGIQHLKDLIYKTKIQRH